ncbi:uncharacterized protein LOC144162144 isoform X2 [Haemaphysalis longicornis]
MYSSAFFPQHHVAKKDLRIDLSVPSLGVLLSQRLHRQASLVAQSVPEVKPTTGTATENQANNVEGRDSPGKDWGGEVVRHRGPFGEGMLVRTRLVTFPTVHKHQDGGEDMRRKAVMRQWKDLMEPREAGVRSLADRLPQRPKVKRRAGDAAFFDFRRPSTPHASTANVVCNCSELLANKTVEELLILVPTLSKAIGETGRNGTVIREFIRASLSKSVLVERIYEEGCRCSCNGTELPRPTAAGTEKTTTGSTTPPSTARSYRTISTRPQPTSTTTEKITSSATTPKSRMAPQEIRMPPTTPPSTRTAAGRSSSKCPKRVFVKFPGEQLPDRARDCRKLWLPENVSKEETFWECEDEGSVECGGRSRIAISKGPAFLSRVVDTSLTTSRATTTTTTRTISSTSPSTTTRAPSTSKTSKKSESTTLPTTLRDCDDSAPATTGGKKTQRLATTTNVLNSTGGWHLKVHIPFYTFRGTQENATHRAEATPEKVTRGHFTTTAVATKSSPKSTTASSRRSTLTTTHTIKSSITKSRPPTKATSSQSSKSTTRRRPTTTTPVPGTLVTSGSSTSGASVCKGAGCQKATPPVVESTNPRTHHHRSTHYHLHDDYDFVWARAPSPIPERPSLVLQYRVGGSTVFPYPYREYEATAAVNDRYPIFIVTNTSAERWSHVHNSNERAFFDRKDSASSVRASTARTTYARYIFGIKDARELEQQRLAYKSYYRNVASRDVQRRGEERAVRPRKSDHVSARKRHRPNRVLERAQHAQYSGDAQVPPVKIDLLKSKISLNAMVNKVKNSGKCRPEGCAENRREAFTPGGIAIRTAPAKGDEYEYYYVYYELPGSEDPPHDEPPNLVHGEGTRRKARANLQYGTARTWKKRARK